VSVPEVSVDDVIQDVLCLFARLGLDAGHLIKRVRGAGGVAETAVRAYPHASAIGDLLTMWHRDPRYLDATGAPRPLKMRAARRSFKALADRCVPDLPADQLLRELERLGTVRIDANGAIHVQTRALHVYEDNRLATLHTLNSLRGFIKTLTHNLDSPRSNSSQLFHRVAWNGELDADSVSELKVWLRRHGQSLLESTDLWMMNKSKRVAAAKRRPKHAVQASVGLYLAVDKP
jgi:hypothetical protein